MNERGSFPAPMSISFSFYPFIMLFTMYIRITRLVFKKTDIITDALTSLTHLLRNQNCKEIPTVKLLGLDVPSKNPKFFYLSTEKKSYSITRKQLIGRRWYLIKIIGLIALRIHLADTTHAVGFQSIRFLITLVRPILKNIHSNFFIDFHSP